MNKEYFKILREISSLDSNIMELDQNRLKEEKRILLIESARDDAKHELIKQEDHCLKLKKENISIENEIEVLTSNCEKIKAQLTTADGGLISEKLESTMSQLELQRNQLEETYFSHLEQIENSQEQINDKKMFLKGSLESLEEITKDVKIFCDKNLNDITLLRARIINLKSSLPEDFKSMYEKTLLLNLKVSLFTKIINNACNVCRMTVTAPLRDSVEKQLQLKSCSNCRRIFLPYSSL